jgi:hypothetical protein
MIEAKTWLRLQRLRHARDLVSGDVRAPSPDRLKSRGIDLTATLGRMARECPHRPGTEILNEVLLGTAGAANLLRLDLSRHDLPACDASDPLRALASAVGAFADGCEKIDHLEDFRPPAVAGVLGLAAWCSAVADLTIEEAPGGAELRIRIGAVQAAPAPRTEVA